MDAREELSYEYLKARRAIDRSALDRAVTEHADLIGDAREQAVLAKSRAVEAKEDLSICEARLYRTIEKKMANDGERITDPAIKSKVQTHPVRAKAFARWLEAEEQARKWDALADTYKDRGHCIHELVTLIVEGLTDARAVKGGEHVRKFNQDDRDARRARMAEARKQRA